MQLKPVGEQYWQRPTTPPSQYINNLWTTGGNQDALNWLMKDRALTPEVIQKFKVGVNETGYIAIPIFKDAELIDYKFRDYRTKTFFRTPRGETWAINEEAFEIAREKGYLVITEGEFDAMAVYQMGIKAVVSGTGGVDGRTEWLERVPDDIKIYLSVDSDEPGQKYARKLAEILGLERCYNVILPTKDANDFVLAGHTGEEYLEILKNAQRFDLPGINKIADAIEELRKNPIQRNPVNLERFNIHTKGGVVKNGLITITAKPGTGKSSLLLNFLIYHADHGIPVLLISLENDMMLTLQRILEIRYKRVIGQFDDELWERAKDELAQYPFYIDTSKEINTTRKLEKVVKLAKKLYGIGAVGYDHVGMITAKKDELPEIARHINEIKNENNITMYIISHVRKGERDQKVISSDDIYGTAAFHQLSNVVILLQNFGKGMELTIDKSRESQSHLRIPVIFNGETGEMMDDMSRKVKFFDQEINDDEKVTPFVVPTTVDEEPHKPEGMLEDVDY